MEKIEPTTIALVIGLTVLGTSVLTAVLTTITNNRINYKKAISEIEREDNSYLITQLRTQAEERESQTSSEIANLKKECKQLKMIINGLQADHRICLENNERIRKENLSLVQRVEVLERGRQ